jgi:5-methyltetrahydropteroyltriglutamate--homocysteine methyltransferase
MQSGGFVTMKLPTEPIGSIPRPQSLIDALKGFQPGDSPENLQNEFRKALRETIQLFEQTGSPVITDGEQTKPSFATYPIQGAGNLQPGGVTIAFADGHTRQLPVLTSGPFRYQVYSDQYLKAARELTSLPVKQAVISASALSLLYPQNGIPGYSREEFLGDLINESEKDIRRSLQAGAYNVQVDFTEARLALKLDPSKGLLKAFIDLNNQVLSRFSTEERKKIGVHTCPGGDQDSTHSADVDYADLLPELLQMDYGSFYIQMASEKDQVRILRIIEQSMRKGQRIFIGVIDPIHSKIESPDEVRDRILQAAEILPVDQLGTTDDCGFAPFGDDTSTSRQTAFKKIRARVEGTEQANQRLAG